MSEHIKITEERLRRILKDADLRAIGLKDFAYTFEQLGVSPNMAAAIGLNFFLTPKLDWAEDLNEFEKEFYEFHIAHVMVGEKTLPEVVATAFGDRAEKIFGQVKEFFTDISSVVDYGTGDGMVLKRLHEEYSFKTVVGYDVVDYMKPSVVEAGITKVIYHTAAEIFSYEKNVEAVLLTNVLHHEVNNQRIIDEVTRSSARRVVLIETVPVGTTPEDIRRDADRTFINDYLYNRILHFGANVPTPGTYETPQGWINRWEGSGWKNVYSDDLGVDQPTIRDTHHLLVFER